MINGEKYRIVTKEQKSTLVIKCVESDDFGYYVCKAMNDAGETITRAKLIESSKAFMSAEEIEENQKKIEKRLAKKVKVSRKASITEGKSSSSVNIEATVQSERRSSKSLKKVSSESVDVAASFKAKPNRQSQKSERRQDVSSELTIVKHENIIVQEIEETFIKEVEHLTCEKTVNISELKNLADLKNCKEVNCMMEKLNSKGFTTEKASLRELSTIAYMIKKGLSLKAIETLFQSNAFPDLQTPESQCALVQLLERHGEASLVTDILSEKSEKEIDENLAASAGFRAFMKMIGTKCINVEDIILSITPKDFTASNWEH